jgi:hypothetical protein
MDLVWGQFTTVPLFLILFLFPLINLKSATFFTKFNALGTVSILFILSSVLYRWVFYEACTRSRSRVNLVEPEP